MIAVWRLSKVVRLTLAAGLSLAATQTATAADAWSQWSPETVSYAADADADIRFVSDCGCNQCDECNGNTCCKPCWTCIAGVEATFLVPEIDDGRISAEFTDGATTTVDNDELDLHDMNFAPRVWMGLHRGCWGIVGRFWYLDTCDGIFDPFELDGFGYDGDSNLEMQTIDLEVTRDMCVRGTRYTGSFGLRYASFNHETDLQTIAHSDATDTLYVSDSYFQQYARGTGLTSSIAGYSPIRGTCVSWFYSARGSYLFGHTDTVATTGVAAGAGAAQAISTSGAVAEIDEPFIIAELQLGVVAEYRLKCYPANAFVRVAGEFQHWSGDESQSASDDFLGAVIGPDASLMTVESSTAGLDTNLFGISIATGLSY